MQLRSVWLAVIAVMALGGMASADTKAKGRMVVTDTSIEILNPVTFEKDKAKLTAGSFAILDAISSTLKGNPGILLVEVQSHTDDRGDEKHNLALSQERADAVRNYLVASHLDPSRLTAQGYGGTQPIDRAHNAAAWAKNERVAFLILKRSSDQ